MNDSRVASELMRSPLWLAATLALWGTGIAWMSDDQPSLPLRTTMLVFAIGLFAAAGVIWAATAWNDLIGRWFAILAAILTLHGAILWLNAPFLLGILFVPVAFAVVLVGLRGALLVAVVQTLLLWGQSANSATVDPNSFAISLTSLWASIVALFLIYRPALGFAYSARAELLVVQQRLHDARERNAELDGVLDELMRANRQLDLLNERLAALRSHAEAAQQAKATFVSKVSHELRTPLNMIIGLVDLLIERPQVYGNQLPAALHDDLHIVHRNCIHLSAMINDVLDLSQTETGRLSLHKEWVDLAQEIQDAAEVVHPLFVRKKLALQINLSGELPVVYCDRTRIRQVVLNLLSNAGRYTMAGSVTVQALQQGNEMVVIVTDTGPGIAPEEHARIFEPFYQGGSEAIHARDGTGLGLSICKQFVELHGGRMWVDSQLGIGSAFSFKLPISPPLPPQEKPVRWITEDWDWYERRERPAVPELEHCARVLLWDETGQLRTLLDHCADELEIVEAVTLDQAQRELARCPAHLLMANTAVPEQLLPLMQSIAPTAPDTPIVGCIYPSPVEHFLAASVVDYLIKPVMRGDIEEAMLALDEPVHRVLIVDDDADFRNLMVRMVQTCDPTLEIVTAEDGQMALEVMQSAAPELVFLDVMLPYLNGWQVLEQKQRNVNLQHIPVILVTSQDPADRPPSTPVLMVGMGEHLSFEQTVRCALGVSELLLAKRH
jgi:signal transduction histidine kinase/CheY-like chemotaxis protein